MPSNKVKVAPNEKRLGTTALHISYQAKFYMHCRGRSKFGFGFGAESWQMASFGVVSVSAEARK